MAVPTLSALSSLGPYQNSNQPFKISTTLAQSSFEKTFIEIATSEGDTVTLQRSTSHAALSQSVQWQNPSSQGVALNAQSLDSHSFSYTVQGDLSDQELKDLGELFDALSLIADDFFQGHLDEAMAGALNIGGLGSLTSLSATFSKTEIFASQITSSQPYAMTDVAKTDSDENALARHRQAQWQQILAYLEKREQDLGHLEQKDASEIRDHAQEMMAKIQKTLEHHQRLAPLVYKLAEKAIADQQHDLKTNNPSQKDQSSLSAKMNHEFEKMLARSERV